MTYSIDVVGSEAPYSINWAENYSPGYKLAEIAQPNGFMNDLPCEETFFTFQKLYEHDNCVVNSELNSGRSHFIHAYQAYLNSKNTCWVFVKADAWDRVVFQSSENDKPSEEFLEAVEALKMRSGIGTRMELLKKWLETKDCVKTVLILRGLSDLEDEDAEEIAAVLRQLYDYGVGPAKDKLSIVIVDTFDSVFSDAAIASGYINLCYQYRLPYFDKHDIKALLSKMELKCVDFSLNKILEHTGGQPRLVQEFLRRLQQLDKAITPRLMDRVAKNMRSNPPVITKRWQEELAQILTNEPELIHSLQAYVSGFSLSALRFPPPAQERSLFLAGWLQHSRERWGISSSLHADLARPVLEKVTGRLNHEK